MHVIYRSVAIGILGLGLIIATMVRVDARGPATTKVGYVDLHRTLNETKVGKRARNKLEKEQKRGAPHSGRGAPCR